MLNIKLGEKTYGLATSLRVVYALRDITGAKSLQDAIASISHLDLNGQIDLLYAAYKAGEGRNDVSCTKEAFVDAVLDNLGIFAIADCVNKLADGLMYSGLSPEEAAAKKAQVEETVAAGAISSAKATVTD